MKYTVTIITSSVKLQFWDVWSNTVKYNQTQSSTVKHSQRWLNTVKYGKTWSNVWPTMVRYFRLYKHHTISFWVPRSTPGSLVCSTQQQHNIIWTSLFSNYFKIVHLVKYISQLERTLVGIWRFIPSLCTHLTSKVNSFYFTLLFCGISSVRSKTGMSREDWPHLKLIVLATEIP